jgi:hypothetical protein
MTVIARLRFDHHVNAAFISLDDRQRASGRLQQRRQLSFYEPALLIRIADVAQRGTHVKGTARLALEKHIIAAQVNLSGFACGSQLLQVSVAEFSLFVLLVANGLRVCDSLGDGNGLSC